MAFHVSEEDRLTRVLASPVQATSTDHKGVTRRLPAGTRIYHLTRPDPRGRVIILSIDGEKTCRWSVAAADLHYEGEGDAS